MGPLPNHRQQIIYNLTTIYPDEAQFLDDCGLSPLHRASTILVCRGPGCQRDDGMSVDDGSSWVPDRLMFSLWGCGVASF
jgi:hypothetical protein